MFCPTSIYIFFVLPRLTRFILTLFLANLIFTETEQKFLFFVFVYAVNLRNLFFM